MGLNIKDAMSAKRVGIDVIAALLAIHRNSASSKLAGKTEFTISEAIKIRSELFPEYDICYLFSDEK